MKTFLISLETQPRRRKQLVQDLERLGLEYEIFDAVNGYQLSDEELNRLCDLKELEKHKSWFSKGVMGCSLSHYSVYKRIIEQNLPYALVVEDDAKLPGNMAKVLNNIKPDLLENEVMLMYNQTGGGVCRISSQDCIKIDKTHTLYYPVFPTPLGSAVAYIITRKACEIMVACILPVRKPSDD